MMKFTCALRYRRLLSPYLDGELDARVRSRLESHLDGCSGCHALSERMSLASRLVSHIAVPDSVPASDGFTRKLTNVRRPRSRASRLVFSPVAVALLVIAAVGSTWYFTPLSNSPWEVIRLHGTPRIGSQSVVQTAQLGEGQWLETDGESRAKVNVGRIGQVEVAPNSRVKLVETSVTEHRLSLERGQLKATIWAPPRVFFVDTPSAEAIDLGCAYTLEVDDNDRGLLHVTSGWVALLLNGRESKVPAGALCATRPEVGPGTPYFQDAPKPLQEALTKVDFEGGGTKALDLVLAAARARDTLTLYHLLARVEEADRGRVYDRLAEYNQPPDGVTREGITRLDGEMLVNWRDALEPTWLKERRTVLRKLWRWIWS
jgi:predicted anti-sigma-YlaC factor YlaD